MVASMAKHAIMTHGEEKTMKKLTLPFILFLMLCMNTACGIRSSTVADAHIPTEEDLLHRNFVLVSIDGREYVGSERLPNLEFNEGFRISGVVCNRYTGLAEMKNGLLVVRQMASTKMLCADHELNLLEDLFTRMVMGGVEISLDSGQLTLRGEGHMLVYRLRDWV